MSPSRRLLGYVGRYRGAFLAGFVCIVATTALTLAGPWVLRYAIDDLTRTGVTPAKLRFYAGAILALTMVGGVFRFLQRRIIIGASRDIEFDLRNDFFARLQLFEPAYFHRNRTGDLMSRATNDLNAVRMMIGPAFMYLSNTILTFVAVIVVMLSLNVRLTLLSLIPLPILSVAVYLFGAEIHRRFDEIQEQLATISAVVQEALSGVRVVRAYRQEQFETGRFRSANDEYVRRNRKLIRVQGAFFPIMGLLMGVGSLLILWLGARDVINGRMTVGELVAFNSYLMMLAWPMIAFGWVTNLLQRGSASWKRMLEVLTAEPAITDEGASARITTRDEIRGDIEFRDLTFSYGDVMVLRRVSATLPAGTTTAIVGATGSGKSTLLNLLPRLNDPPPGTVFVDGIDVRELTLAALRGAIGFVPQEPFLFSATIAENIAFGVASAARERIEHAAHVSRLDKDLSDFPKGYDTVVGERGITLSGGQKQRTAIARAVMMDPKILVLDDALSAVDTYTEEEILSRLSGVMRSRTTIIVSHRISTVRTADQILVLDDGAIVERGTHDQLVARNGLYAELYRKQLLEEELAAS
ncbi:MAG TPA: ABC transporter ATP-binding protein [Vicinamibacterales bacterium]|jgi:ATP-binding cassette subfamily B multidrug efflux pump|nr:ABC transporter ATP-binding protein [Vicinamibacterales bacterium]